MESKRLEAVAVSFPTWPRLTTVEFTMPAEYAFLSMHVVEGGISESLLWRKSGGFADCWFHLFILSDLYNDHPFAS